MRIYPIPTGNFKLDGGAMFGVVPKSLWQRTNPADSNNMCSWALRCMLIEKGDRLMLIDNGMGEKQSEKFFSYYYLHGDDSLENSLKINGFHPDDITDVFLTHLHFDHCGGGVKWNKDRTAYEPTFKNATYWSNAKHWKWATVPNDREKASFLKENILPMQEFGQLKFVEEEDFDWFEIFYANGHTDAQMIPIIDYQGKKLVFMADLLPSAGHIPLPYVMGYDTRPLLTLKEKKEFLDRAVQEDFYLFLEHDADNEVISLQDTEKGPRLKDSLKFYDLFEK
ncbi:MAG: MBL fold metallo-hydrolase [Flavobacteriales bacterium]|nr:MBL fold metallo-hydrolase [Flavobacteriales bacterium]|tara:strand:+ start:540 stop:1382 length:843 start_codon:yes stop_codon:yes gene_type:complete